MMSPRKKKITGSMLPPKAGVRVRMYDTGFGDCFLLAFPTQTAGAYYMLIDCGVHHRYSGGGLQMQKVARDIAAATGSHLDLVVVTHEHTDHTWGFRHAQDIFNTIEIDNLWLAWTEDPDDPLAQLLKRQYAREVAGLTAAIQKLSQPEKAFAAQLQAFFEFEPAAVGSSKDETRLDELEFLRKKSLKKLTGSKYYRQPGEPPLALTGVAGVRVFVLGPPKDKNLIKILEKNSELYPEDAAFDEISAFSAAALAGDEHGASLSEEQTWVARNRPFDASYGIPAGDAAAGNPDYQTFFSRYYGFSTAEGQADSWRRIDHDWLNGAEQLALSINSKTNNTSLVLAIEINAQEVLLFAADAQVGNWLSWQKLEWPGADQGGGNISGIDLLNRTVLYKVGHHGSRNATLNRKGLEQMTHPDLVAMIPVNEKWAREEMGWEHPAPVLLSTLREKTRERVIRMDEIPTGETPPTRPEQIPVEIWEEFVQRLNWDRSEARLWVEYTLETGNV